MKKNPFYDYKEGYLSDEDRKNVKEMNPVVLYYKTYGFGDLDHCKPIQDIYVFLYNKIYGIEHNENELLITRSDLNNQYVLRGDTLTSVFTILKRYFILNCPGEVLVGKKMKQDVYDGLVSELMEKFRSNSITNKNVWMLCMLKNSENFFIKDDELSREMKKFISLSHSMGNFMPLLFRKGGGVKLSFNAMRSRYGKADSADKFFRAIYLYFETGKTPFFAKSEEAEKDFKIWMSFFDNSWDKFVEYNFLSGYVKESKKGKMKFGRPDKFCNYKYIESQINNKDELLEFLKNVNKFIETRGTLMAEALEKKVSRK